MTLEHAYWTGELVKGAILFLFMLGVLGIIFYVLEQIWPTNQKKSPAKAYADEIGWAKAGHWPTVGQLLELDRLQRQERGK